MESALARAEPRDTISCQEEDEDPGKETENLGSGVRRKTGIFVVTSDTAVKRKH